MKCYAISAAVGACCLAFSPLSSANSFYLGLGAAYRTVDGDFEGNSAIPAMTSSDVILLPKIDGAWGGTLFGGYSFTSRWAIEVGYTKTKHDATFGTRKLTADYHSLDIDFKYHFLDDTHAVRPYGLFGLNIDVLNVKDGTRAGSFGPTIGDAKYIGSGLNLGLGVDYFVTEHVSTGLGATYRFVQYSSAESPNTSGGLTENVSGDGYAVNLNVAYHF